MFFRKCLNKQYAAQSRVCFFSRTTFLSGGGEQRKWRIRNGRREGGMMWEGKVAGYLKWEKVYVYLKE